MATKIFTEIGIMRKIVRDTRNFTQRLWCKWFHVDERYIDTSGELDFHAVCLAHKCFKGAIVVSECWLENEFKEKINQF